MTVKQEVAAKGHVSRSHELGIKVQPCEYKKQAKKEKCKDKSEK